MKYACVVVLFFAALAAVNGYRENDQFAQQFVKQHLGCLLQRSPCTSASRKVKAMLPHIVDGDCALCSARQRAMVGQIARYMKSYHPHEWNRILQLYG